MVRDFFSNLISAMLLAEGKQKINTKNKIFKLKEIVIIKNLLSQKKDENQKYQEEIEEHLNNV